MSGIHLTTFVAAPVERVFDLSRHLAVYKFLFNSRKEIFSSRAASNLVNKGETISLTAKHLGRTRSLTLKITQMEKGVAFTEEQIKGDLQNYRHEHFFKRIDNGTIMIDMLEFGAPRDLPGRLLSKFYLKKYFEELVQKRHEVIRRYAETENWRAVLT